MLERARRAENRTDTLEEEAEQWRQRLLRAQSRRAAVRRRGRLCQRRIHQLRSTLTALQAELADLEQQAAAALETSDRERARTLSGRFREQDATVQVAVSELRRLESSRRRLALLEQCWGWRAGQHERTGALCRPSSLLPASRARRYASVTGGAIRAR